MQECELEVGLITVMMARCRLLKEEASHRRSLAPVRALSSPPEEAVVTNRNYDGPWSKGDLFFLMDSLEHGMRFGDVARFLCRTEDEVRKKRKAMSRKRACT